MLGLKNARNALTHVVDGASYMVGISLCSFSVIMPSYVKNYTDNPFLLAMIPFLVDVGISVPQILSAFLSHRKGPPDERKTVRNYFFPALITRSLIAVLGISVLVFSADRNAALISFFIMIALFCLSLGFTTPNWINVLSMTIPDKVRAEFLGKRELIARLVGIVFSFALPVILALNRFPLNYGILFLVSGLIMTGGIFPALFYRKTVSAPRTPPENQNVKFTAFFRSSLKIITGNKKLLTLLTIYWFLSLSRISTSFYTPYIIDNILSRQSIESSRSLLSAINITLLLSMALASPVIGKLIRKIGHIRSILIGIVSLFTAIVILIASPCVATAIIGQVFVAIFTISAYLVSLNAVMDFAKPGERAVLSAFNNTINAVFITFFTMLGGTIASIFNYEAALIFTAFLTLVMIVVVMNIQIAKGGYKERKSPAPWID